MLNLKNKRKLKTRDIVWIGQLATLCIVATFIKIPFGSGAMVNLGTGFIFISGILFGGVYTGLAAAIGSAFYDVLMGFSAYTIWSFIIKGIAGFIMGYIAKGMWPEDELSRKNWMLFAIGGAILTSLWTLVAYFLAWWQVIGSFNVAITNIPASLMTTAVGFILAAFLVIPLKKILNQNII